MARSVPVYGDIQARSATNLTPNTAEIGISNPPKSIALRPEARNILLERAPAPASVDDKDLVEFLNGKLEKNMVSYVAQKIADSVVLSKKAPGEKIGPLKRYMWKAANKRFDPTVIMTIPIYIDKIIAAKAELGITGKLIERRIFAATLITADKYHNDNDYGTMKQWSTLLNIPEDALRENELVLFEGLKWNSGVSLKQLAVPVHEYAMKFNVSLSMI